MGWCRTVVYERLRVTAVAIHARETARLPVVSLTVTVGAQGNRVLYSILSALSKWDSVVDFEVWSPIRSSNEWCGLMTPFTDSIRPQ